ncbi:MAG: hypothetical protein K2X32_14540 [Phycisphaerales bacterium]|nr:hypothetical protein [Phycisphaerales bacterium]
MLQHAIVTLGQAAGEIGSVTSSLTKYGDVALGLFTLIVVCFVIRWMAEGLIGKWQTRLDQQIESNRQSIAQINELCKLVERIERERASKPPEKP